MKFEKVSLNQFNTDLANCLLDVPADKLTDLYDHIMIPSRATLHSAGYDFALPVRIIVHPGSTITVPSGIKCHFSALESENWHLKLYIRSSVGIHRHIRLANGTGVIDADYYNNPDTEGDIFIALHNYGHAPVIFNPGDKIMQGVFECYGLTEDDVASMVRSGGIGSTGR